MDSSLVAFAFMCITSFFTLTNPLGTMPVFLTMTKGMAEQERARIVRRATIISFITLLAFTVCGQFLFTFFGISTNGFRIAAGFIILKIGFDMLQARYSNTKLTDEEITTYANDISITPLSIPMLCGPGAIANGIMLMDSASDWRMQFILFSSIAIIYFITYLILRASTRLVKILGETGNNVMMRLMGLILMVIAVECFVAGLRPILISIIEAAR
ncbi:MAG: MarC family protein [Muribaculaceae bacterium]|nr:MarC family protein [Muribaculaceae bacterium]